MKKIIWIWSACACLAGSVKAQDAGGVQPFLGADLVSSYIWRGNYNAGASLQPTLGMRAGGFSLTAWGSVDLNAFDYKELDLTASYRVGRFSFSLTDYYWTGAPNQAVLPKRNYFRFGSDSPHIVEVGASFTVSPRFPLAIAWNTMLFGADRDDGGRQNYSTYVELSYPFTVKGVDMNVAVGFTPWATPNMYGTDGFAVDNVLLGATKAIRFSDSFSLPIFTRVIWNPAKDDAHIVGGFSIML